MNASASLFQLLGVKPLLGRTFNENEDRYGAPKVAVLSYAFWRNSFGADPRVLGRTIWLDGQSYAIVGVMPPAFQFPYPATQLWLPLALKPDALKESERAAAFLQGLGRLAPGINQQRAQTVLAAFSQRMVEMHPYSHPAEAGWRFVMRPFTEERTQAIRRWIELAFGAVLCVLAIVCANVSGLLAIQLVQQVFTEVTCLAGAGCGLGVVLAAWAIDFSKSFVPGAEAARLHGWVLLFICGVAAMCACAAGIWPAYIGSRISLQQCSRERRSLGRTMLVAGQLSIAVALLFTATLLCRSFLKLMAVPPGFEAQEVWSGAIQLPK